MCGYAAVTSRRMLRCSAATPSWQSLPLSIPEAPGLEAAAGDAACAAQPQAGAPGPAGEMPRGAVELEKRQVSSPRGLVTEEGGRFGRQPEHAERPELLLPPAPVESY
jgi:hypothetical protein